MPAAVVRGRVPSMPAEMLQFASPSTWLFLPDSRVQHIVDESIYSYKSHGADAFDTINDQELNRLSMCPMVGNETHITANGGNPDKAGTPYESLAAAMPAQKHGTAGS